MDISLEGRRFVVSRGKKKEKNYPLGESEVLLFILLHVVYTRRVRVARYDRSLIGDNLKEKEKKKEGRKNRVSS